MALWQWRTLHPAASCERARWDLKFWVKEWKNVWIDGVIVQPRGYWILPHGCQQLPEVFNTGFSTSSPATSNITSQTTSTTARQEQQQLSPVALLPLFLMSCVACAAVADTAEKYREVVYTPLPQAYHVEGIASCTTKALTLRNHPGCKKWSGHCVVILVWRCMKMRKWTWPGMAQCPLLRLAWGWLE